MHELEKVDDRFFEVHDEAEEDIEELDSNVLLSSDRANYSGTMDLPRNSRMNGIANRVFDLILRREKCLRVTHTLEDLIGQCAAHPNLTIEFTQTNVSGFKKILKKFDKHFRYRLRILTLTV